MLNPDRPKLSEELEQQFVAIDQRSAECYGALEEISEKLDVAAEKLNSQGVVMKPLTDSDTLVTRIEGAKEAVRRRATPTGDE